MTAKTIGVMFVLSSVLLLAPAALAGDGTLGGALNECIVTYVAQNEGEPMRVEGTPEPIVEEPPAVKGPAALTGTNDSWDFEITPYLWTIGINGNFLVKGASADVDVDFGDILDVADMALSMRGEAWHGPIGFTLDITWLTASEESSAPGPLVGGDLGLDMLIAEFTVSYLFDWPLTDEPGDKRLLTIEPIVGVRYVDLRMDVGIDLGPISLPTVDGSQDWIEPFVGFRTRVQLSDHWTVAGGVNFGGFDIGSRLTWVAFLGVDYRFTKLFSAKLGYKWMDIDYTDGSGINRFEMDATIQGFWIGLSFHF